VKRSTSTVVTCAPTPFDRMDDTSAQSAVMSATETPWRSPEAADPCCPSTRSASVRTEDRGAADGKAPAVASEPSIVTALASVGKPAVGGARGCGARQAQAVRG